MTNEELVYQYQNTNDNRFLSELYQQNLYLIKSIAAKYNVHDQFEDLCQEGFLGLNCAADRYDPKADSSFVTYAKYWIRHYILSYCENNSSLLRVPFWMQERVREYRDIISGYKKAHGYDPDADYIINKLNITFDELDDIRFTIDILSSNTSLEQNLYDDEKETIADTVPDPDNQIDDLLDDIQRQELKKVLWNIVDSLKGKEPDVLRLRYQQGKTLHECSSKLDISPERVRQYEFSGVRRIRNTRRKALEPFVSDLVYRQGLRSTGLKSYKNNSFTSSVERDAITLESILSGDDDQKL